MNKIVFLVVGAGILLIVGIILLLINWKPVQQTSFTGKVGPVEVTAEGITTVQATTLTVGFIAIMAALLLFFGAIYLLQKEGYEAPENIRK